jgi:hypothetical protein
MTKLIHATLVVITLSLTVSGQMSDREALRTAVIIPADVGLAVVVSQPECPLKIEGAQLLAHLKGGAGATYRLRNVGRKTIDGYTIATWYSNNSGTVDDWHAIDGEPPILPGHFQKDSNETRIVPLTDELRVKLDIRPPMRTIRFFMIVEVTFSDGTKYDAKQTFAALQSHLENFEPVYEKLGQ